MKAVIPCAKKKESMFPLSETKPTGLMPVGGVPIVKKLIRALEKIGADDIYIVTNHLEEQFEEEFGEYTNINIVHQETLNGTAGAVEACNFIEEEFIVVNGDVMISESDLERLSDKHSEKAGKICMLATYDDKPEKFGVLSITHDRVDSIVEKPDDAENKLVNSGIYLLEPEIFDLLGDKDDLTDAVSEMAEAGDAYFEIIEDYWLDIGSPQKLWEADRTNREYSSKEIDSEAEIHEEAVIEGNSVVEKGAKIKAGTVIEGKCFIGSDAVVGPNTVVRNSSIGPRCQLRDCSIEKSVLFEDSILDSFVSVENSVIGEKSDFKSGSVIKESFIGARSFVEMNNSIRGVKFVPDARTDLSEISK